MLKKNYDEIVVGSGISGMTLALLLSMNGRSVLLIEKAADIGGSVKRFHKKGVPFDTGFHFTGGLTDDGILMDMLKVLSLDKSIVPLFLKKGKENKIVFEDSGVEYEVPIGLKKTISYLKENFPDDKNAIDLYFKNAKNDCEKTISLNLRSITELGYSVDNDYVSLKDFLDKITDNELLKTILSLHTVCIGAKPSELSFANYSRARYNLYQSVARVIKGGDAFIDAFKKQARKLNIDIISNSEISNCIDINNKLVGKFVLNSGEEISANHCIFTIHPFNILKILPKEYLSNAFKNRVGEFEPSIGFFAVFAVVEPDEKIDQFEHEIVSLLPDSNLEKLLETNSDCNSALVIMKSCETVDGKKINVLNALEITNFEEVKKWENSKTGKRPQNYYNYKTKKQKQIINRILHQFPIYKNKLKVLDAATMLTFRDYLNSPFGCAYGIKQKMNQYNLFGKLPLKNIFAAGQSAALPGLIGAMMSSFIIARLLIGKEEYNKFINDRL